MGICLVFGYYPVQCDIRAGDIRITSVPDLAERVADTEAYAQAHQGFVYAPAQRNKDIMTGKTTRLPYKSRIFGLPRTHKLEHASADSIEHLEFLVWCFGFFTGFTLTTYEAGCLDAAPISRDKLTDFFVLHQYLDKVVAISNQYWLDHSGHGLMTKRLTGIINAYFLSKNPTAFPHEKFMYLYVALDACYAQTRDLAKFNGEKPKKVSHGERIDWMCEYLGIPKPEIEVADLRNNTPHEALFLEEPLGFMKYNPSDSATLRKLLYMGNLVCRLVVALLGVPCKGYCNSNAKTRNPYALELI